MALDERDRALAETRAAERAKAAEGVVLGNEWSERVLGLAAPDGLREMVESHRRLHDAACKAGDFKAASLALQRIEHLTGFGRTLTDGIREAAAMTLEQRAQAMLEDADLRATLVRLLSVTKHGAEYQHEATLGSVVTEDERRARLAELNKENNR